jgi:hypothetical protein
MRSHRTQNSTIQLDGRDRPLRPGTSEWSRGSRLTWSLPIRNCGPATPESRRSSASLTASGLTRSISASSACRSTVASPTRHGPRDIRNQSSLIRKINQATGVAPFELLRVADLGDAWIERPFELEGAHAEITAFFTTDHAAGVVPLSVGGDHRSLLQFCGPLPGMDRSAWCTFDIDCVDPAYAPGTGTPEPGGLTTLEAQRLIRRFGGLDSVGADLVEVSPPFDASGITGMTAATILYELLCVLAQAPRMKMRARPIE